MDDVDELAPALAAFQAEAPVIPNTERAQIRTNSGEGYGYRYASLGTIMPIVAPLLAKHGLAFTAMPKRTMEGVPMLLGLLLHTSGQSLQGELPITGRTPQEIGSSLTYGRRYLLCCLTGIVTDDDDDGRLAEQAERVRGGVSAIAASLKETPTPSEERRPTPLPRRPAEASGPDRSDTQPLNTSSALAKRMYASIREAGISQENVHQFMSEVTGREITTSKDLTQGEAWRILDFLPQRPPVAPEDEP